MSVSRHYLARAKDIAANVFLSLFPSRCILCLLPVSDANRQHIELCDECYAALPVLGNACNRCALPLAENITDQPLCGRCIRRLPDYDYVRSLFRYENDVIKLVHQLKFSEKISYARSIGEMLVSLSKTSDQPECFLPVPLHPSRLRQRGYNQSIEIARVLSKKTGIAIELDAVKRRRSTTSQTGLDMKQRKKNIKGAFEWVGSKSYRHVVIVDDVMTTGATVNELARLLKKHKVEKVGVICIARAPLKT